MSIDDAVALVPSLAIPSKAVLKLAHVLASPRAFGELSNRETIDLLDSLQGAIDAGFSAALAQRGGSARTTA